MASFGKALKGARAKRFNSARECAQVLGVEENRYRHWERGTAKPDLAMLVRITKLLEIEPNDLFPSAFRYPSSEH